MNGASARYLRLDDGLLPTKRGWSLRTNLDVGPACGTVTTLAEELDWSNVPLPPAELLDQDLSFDLDDESTSDSSSVDSWGDESTDGEYLQSDNESVMGGEMGQDGVVAAETKRLTEVIAAAEDGLMSGRSIDRLLKARPLCSKVSYQSIKKRLQRGSGVERKWFPMCPSGHMVLESGEENCKVGRCGKAPKTSMRFWHLSLVGQLKALAGSGESFDQIRRGQARAVASFQSHDVDAYADYYHGSIFRTLHKASLQQLDAAGETVLYLRMTTDGFKLFENRRKQRSA